MKRIVFNLIALVLIAAFTACNNSPVDDPDPLHGVPVNKITLKIHVPKGSISTYANEDASAAENRIDTLFVDLLQSNIVIESDTIFGSDLQKASNTNDSIVTVAYDVDELVMGTTVRAKVYANRRTVKTITDEIPLPNSPSTAFLMTGEGDLAYNAATPAYEGTIHVVRDVAKLRINVSKDVICLPSDLLINYALTKIEVLRVPNQTSLFGPTREEAAGQTGFNYINYAERTGINLRNSNTFSTSTGGQIDSLYLNENYRTTSNYSEGTNTTQVKITLTTTTSSGGQKTDSYTYTLKTNNSFDIIRNYIYTLDIKVRGQSLEPLIALSLRPWDDVSIDGSIGGTYLTMQTSEIEFDANGYAEIAFCTDAQAVYVDYDEFNDNNGGIKIGDQIKPVGIQPADPNLTPGYEGQVLVDKKVCTSFGFQVDAALINSGYNFSGNICLKAGNIVKCISFVGQRYYDAHFIVGDTLLNPGDQFTSARVVTENGGNWLEVSPNRLYTTAATQNYSGTAMPLYLHLDENLTGATRKGSVTVVVVNGVEKKIYIQQLPALPVGRFGDWDLSASPGHESYGYQLWTEQLHEYTVTPRFKYPNDNIGGYEYIYSGYDWFGPHEYDKYDNPPYFNWQAALYQATNYCFSKNRPDKNSGSNGKIVDRYVRWYLPSQAQLMAMWVAHAALYPSTSNFPTDDSYWSMTNNALYPSEAQYVNFKYGNVGHMNRSEKNWVRCVRGGGGDYPGTPLTTSMVSANGKSIDIDFTQSMPTATYTSTSKGNGSGNDASTVNATVYRKLRIDSINNGTAKTWDEAKTICAGLGANWRLPTQRELQAIWILNLEIQSKGNGFANFANDYYWTATESSGYSTNAYMVYMSTGPAGEAGNTPHAIKTHKASVRCVLELP